VLSDFKRRPQHNTTQAGFNIRWQEMQQIFLVALKKKLVTLKEQTVFSISQKNQEHNNYP
jgi:hypothetical protein